jgi:RNA polymerase sigma factor (sigma-70 family)
MSGDPEPMTRTTSPAVLVPRALAGDEGAWGTLVARYSPLIWSVCRHFGLTEHDAADIAQTVWVRLIENLAELREPAALPGWIGTTTRREVLQSLRYKSRRQTDTLRADVETVADPRVQPLDAELLVAERNAALRDAIAQLPYMCQDVLRMLTEDPPMSYADVADKLGLPKGSIGPTRLRCLQRLRRTPALARFLDDHADGQG